MLDELIAHTAFALPEQLAILAADEGQATWSELRDMVDRFTGPLEPASGQRVGLALPSGPRWLAALGALDRLAADVFLLDDQLAAENREELAATLELAGMVAPGEAASEIAWLPRAKDQTAEREFTLGSITILTSGTTGQPKAARHTWAGLARPVRGRDPEAGGDEPSRWLLSYRPQLYAGLQVVLQCLATQGTLVCPAAGADPAALAELLSEAAVTHVSATPSWWRRLLMLAPREKLKQAPLMQITLGGEAIDQPLLAALAKIFPQARITHIYATTELGRCFSVTDGLEGFPARFLDAVSPDGVEMRIDEGELCVRSANAMQTYDARGEQPAENAAVDPRQGWFRTGDFVEQREDRVYFIGRKSEMINVGGNKVQPLEVERVLRQIPGVADVRVFAQRSSIAGQLVACELVAAEGEEIPALKKRVQETVRESLLPHQRPRLVNFVDRIELTAAGKTARREKS